MNGVGFFQCELWTERAVFFQTLVYHPRHNRAWRMPLVPHADAEAYSQSGKHHHTWRKELFELELHQQLSLRAKLESDEIQMCLILELLFFWRCVCFVSDRFGWEHCTIPLGFQPFYDFQIIFLFFWFEWVSIKKYWSKCFCSFCVYSGERLQLSVFYVLAFLMLALPAVLRRCDTSRWWSSDHCDVHSCSVRDLPDHHSGGHLAVQHQTLPLHRHWELRPSPDAQVFTPADVISRRILCCKIYSVNIDNLDFFWLVLLLYDILVAGYTAIAIGHHFAVNLWFIWHIFIQLCPDYVFKLKSQSIHDLKCEEKITVRADYRFPPVLFFVFEPVPMRKSVLSITLQQHQPVHCVGVISAKS